MDSSHKEALSKLISKIGDEKQVLVAIQDAEFEKQLENSMDETMIFKLSEWNTKGPEIDS